ncbi:MAG: SRPBCC family protein [Amphiplicatus sp.]
MTAFTHEFTCSISAPKERLFAALTTESDLRKWFAEYVEIDLREGGAFRFWGKHTLGTPDKDEAMQKIKTLSPPDTLSFAWRLLDRDSAVTWSVFEEKGDDGSLKTKLKVAHAFDLLPDGARAKEQIDDLWRLHCGNLGAWVQSGEGMLLPDFNDPNPQVRQTILINASREKVFAALTTPEHLKQWFWAPDPQVEARVGGRYSLGWSYEIGGQKVEGGPTKILELVPNEKLVTDWPDWRGDANVPVQKVEWLLEDAGSGKTKLTLIHSGFTRASDMSDYPFGWIAFAGALRGVAEAL